VSLPLTEATDNRHQRRSTVLSDGALARYVSVYPQQFGDFFNRAIAIDFDEPIIWAAFSYGKNAVDIAQGTTRTNSHLDFAAHFQFVAVATVGLRFPTSPRRVRPGWLYGKCLA
jgi:hypothetical protein